MGAGCEIPPNARPENVKAIIESVFRYGYYILSVFLQRVAVSRPSAVSGSAS